MAKQSGIDKLPASTIEGLDARLRGGVSIGAAQEWLVSEGFKITHRQVRTYWENQSHKIKSAKSIAEINIQTQKIAKAEGLDLGLDFIDRLDYLYSQGLQLVTPDIFAEMRPIDILSAANKYASVKIQAEKFKQEMKDKISIELKALRSDPDINEETLDRIEQKIYGIY